MDVACGDITGVLLIDAGCTLFKGLSIFAGPPVVHVSLRVEAPALIVKSMCDLVADDGTDRTIIDGVIHLDVKKRRLKNSRREVDVILQRVVIGVNRRRCHMPLERIRYSPDLRNPALALKYVGTERIACEISCFDFEL